MKTLITAVTSTFLSFGSAFAGCEMDVSEYVGWQIIYEGTVTGYINDEGALVEEFEGCEYDRILIIDYDRQVTFAEYEYEYAYMPDIVILSDGSNMVACIDDEVMRIRR